MKTFGKDLEHVCDKCGGKGVVEVYRHLDNGFCYKCKGIGKLPYDPKPSCNESLDEDMTNYNKGVVEDVEKFERQYYIDVVFQGDEQAYYRELNSTTL